MSLKAFPALRFLVVLAACWPAAAQEEDPAARFEGLVEVSEVLLDVLATDTQGELVVGLDKDDFLVKEDGQPVEVTGVSFYTTRYGAERAADEIPSSRYFILFFEDQARSSSLLRRQLLDASRQSRRWVEKEMLPSDWVAVASYDVKLKIHQDFTQDRELILSAVQDAAASKQPKILPPSKRQQSATAPSVVRYLPEGKKLRKETTNIYDGLRLLAEATGYIVGRKNLMLFTIGFGDLEPGFLISLPDRRYYPGLRRSLNDHNVAVYPIDLTPEFEGLQTHFLNQLAIETGGYYYRNFVNFITPLRQIADENTGYYLLSYQSSYPAGESGYREVTVKAQDRKIRLRTRRGYSYGS